MPDYVDRVVETRAYRSRTSTPGERESAPSPGERTAGAGPERYGGRHDRVATGYRCVRGALNWRLYRSSTTNDGAEYQFVAEIAIGTLTYNDSLRQEELQELLPSTTWTEPRSDMLNPCGGSNGIMLGSAGKVLCACEPFQPFVWPRMNTSCRSSTKSSR